MNAYILNGTPIALQRHRLNKKTNYFESQKDLKRYLSITLSNIHGDKPMYTGPLALEIRFVFPWRRSDKHNAEQWHTMAPNADVLIKLIFDVGTGILWESDKLICKISLSKTHGEVEQTEFTVVELKNDRKENQKEKK